MKKLSHLIKDDSGASLAEYALLLGIITLAIAAVITAFGSRITTVITNATNALQ